MLTVFRTAQPLLLAAFALASSAALSRADAWPQWLGPQRDGVWRETGILKMIRRPPRSTLFPYTSSSISVVAVSLDRKNTRLNSSHTIISYAVFCLKKK